MDCGAGTAQAVASGLDGRRNVRGRTGSFFVRLLAPVGVSLAIGALFTIGGPIGGLFGPTPAFASCDRNHYQVQGYDKEFGGYGIIADINVNNIDMNDLNDNIFRSIFVEFNPNNNTEFGWSAPYGVYPFKHAAIYTEYKANGSESSPNLIQSVDANTTHRFKQEAPGDPNSNGNYTWKFYLDGNFLVQNTFGYNFGTLETNSERYNTCDTLFEHMTNLNNCTSHANDTCNWWGSFGNLHCGTAPPPPPSSNDYLFNKIDNTELQVEKATGNNC
jgi:hypothetical protein